MSLGKLSRGHGQGGEWGHREGKHEALELLEHGPKAEPCPIPFPAVPRLVELSPALPAPSKPLK